MDYSNLQLDNPKGMTMAQIVIKETTCEGKAAFGLTDGKVWFFYAYINKAQAEAVLPLFNDPERVRVNITYPKPEQIVG